MSAPVKSDADKFAEALLDEPPHSENMMKALQVLQDEMNRRCGLTLAMLGKAK